MCWQGFSRHDTTIEHLRVEARNARESGALVEGLACDALDEGLA
jgi:hypothetical protein